MKQFPSLLMLSVVVVATLLGGRAITARDVGPDKYALQVPGGLAFAEFRGYEGWQVIAVGQADGLFKVTVGNPVMVDAYRAGIPMNGQPFPDGARSAKIMWTLKQSTDAPFAVNVPDALKRVGFMVKDSSRFAGIGGWGYAQFEYDPAADRYAPDGAGVDCGTACHSIVKARDYVFSQYGRR